jgi:hypothetical protein
MASSRQLLCDAPVVIGAHQAGIWDVFVKGYRVAVTGVVLAEAHYYLDQRGDRRLIQLTPQVAAGTIEQHDATHSELKAFDSRLQDRRLASALDVGELEALALIVERRLPHLLCTGDGPAIRALCHLGMGEKSISLERALRDIGYAIRLRLREDLTESKHQRHVAKGMSECKDLGLD